VREEPLQSFHFAPSLRARCLRDTDLQLSYLLMAIGPADAVPIDNSRGRIRIDSHRYSHLLYLLLESYRKSSRDDYQEQVSRLSPQGTAPLSNPLQIRFCLLFHLVPTHSIAFLAVRLPLDCSEGE
jgi:hypothetical protein